MQIFTGLPIGRTITLEFINNVTTIKELLEMINEKEN